MSLSLPAIGSAGKVQGWGRSLGPRLVLDRGSSDLSSFCLTCASWYFNEHRQHCSKCGSAPLPLDHIARRVLMRVGDIVRFDGSQVAVDIRTRLQGMIHLEIPGVVTEYLSSNMVNVHFPMHGTYVFSTQVLEIVGHVDE